MVIEPRFFKHDEKLFLVAVTKDKGRITDINGPYQCVGDATISPQEFVEKFSQIMLVALHASAPLTMVDLPVELREKVSKASVDERVDVQSIDDVVLPE